MRRPRITAPSFALALGPLAALALAGCGGSSGESTAASTTGTAPASSIPTATPVNERRLRLGDERTVDEPKRGSLYSCGADSADSGPLAEGPWIDEAKGRWDSTRKAAVQGSADWPWQFTQRSDEGLRILSGSGLPPHATGVFPVDPSDPAYQYDPNPNQIASYTLRVALTADPRRAEEPACVGDTVGVLRNGIPVYGPLDSSGRDAPAHALLDDCAGHPDTDDRYHYHSLSPCIEVSAGSDASELVGWALDGFGIYVERDAGGTPLSTADLDACHGRTSEVPWNGREVSIYHYVATPDFPYVVGCFRGTPIGEADGLDAGPTDGSAP